MIRERYNPETKECKDCGCLIPDRPQDIAEHICSPYAIERKLKELFGEREPKYKQGFVVGEEVEGRLIGVIDSITTTRSGEIMYRITDDTKNVHGYFLQNQLFPLLEPDIYAPMEQKEEEVER